MSRPDLLSPLILIKQLTGKYPAPVNNDLDSGRWQEMSAWQPSRALSILLPELSALKFSFRDFENVTIHANILAATQPFNLPKPSLKERFALLENYNVFYSHYKMFPQRGANGSFTLDTVKKANQLNIKLGYRPRYEYVFGSLENVERLAIKQKQNKARLQNKTKRRTIKPSSKEITSFAKLNLFGVAPKSGRQLAKPLKLSSEAEVSKHVKRTLTRFSNAVQELGNYNLIPQYHAFYQVVVRLTAAGRKIFEVVQIKEIDVNLSKEVNDVVYWVEYGTKTNRKRQVVAEKNILARWQNGFKVQVSTGVNK